jgi:hypothetical protein
MVGKRFFCVVHGFVVPTDELVPMCPDCDHPVQEVGGTPVSTPGAAPQ